MGDLNGIFKCRPFILHENEHILILESYAVLFLDPFVRLAVPFLCRKLFECSFVERFLFLACLNNIIESLLCEKGSAPLLFFQLRLHSFIKGLLVPFLFGN